MNRGPTRIALALCLLLAPRPCPASGGIDLRWDETTGHVVATGLDAANGLRPDDPRRDEALTVRLARDPGRPEAGPIVGRVIVDGTTARFVPRYPFAAGTRYLARYRSPVEGAAPIEREFSPPAPPAGPETTIEAVYPTAAFVPENLLKLYLQFSAPMSRGEAYRRVKVVDSEGKAIDRPFLEIGEELWDPKMTRLTLLFDPGRIKRGLKPREEEGPILESGKSYTIVVDRDWPDATDRPLAAGLRKPIRVGPPDEGQPDPRRWTFNVPRPGTTTPLVVGFPEPLDRAMLDRAIGVVAGDDPVPGRVIAVDGERGLRFVPDLPWPSGPLALVVDSELEDLAGNSIARPFEVDVVRAPTPEDGPRFVRVPLVPGR